MKTFPGLKWKRWQWRMRRRLAVWLVERLYGEDMLWDDADQERSWGSMDEWAGDVWSPTVGGEETTVTFQRALSLPSIKYRVHSLDCADSDDIDYRFVRLSK